MLSGKNAERNVLSKQVMNEKIFAKAQKNFRPVSAFLLYVICAVIRTKRNMLNMLKYAYCVTSLHSKGLFTL